MVSTERNIAKIDCVELAKAALIFLEIDRDSAASRLIVSDKIGLHTSYVK